MPRRSSCITIPTEKNPNGGPAITKTAAAVQESQESAAWVKEAWQKCRVATVAAWTVNPDPAINHDHDIIAELCQSLGNLDLSDQAHQFHALISEMADFNPESLQFKDDPRTWEEAKNSIDAEWWKEGYMEELKSLKDMGVYKLIPQDDVPQGKCIWKGKPVFHIKWDETGKAVRWKVHIIFKGFEQIYGKDYTKTTSL